MLQCVQCTARPTNDAGIHSGGGTAGTVGAVGAVGWNGWGASIAPCGIVHPHVGQKSVPGGGEAPQWGQNAMLLPKLYGVFHGRETR